MNKDDLHNWTKEQIEFELALILDEHIDSNPEHLVAFLKPYVIEWRLRNLVKAMDIMANAGPIFL